MVEAQGKGTLLCHMMVWIKGNPSLQELRDKLQADVGFKQQMFNWLESTISNHLPHETDIDESERAERPFLSYEPRSCLHPQMKRFHGQSKNMAVKLSCFVQYHFGGPESNISMSFSIFLASGSRLRGPRASAMFKMSSNLLFPEG